MVASSSRAWGRISTDLSLSIEDLTGLLVGRDDFVVVVPPKTSVTWAASWLCSLQFRAEFVADGIRPDPLVSAMSNGIVVGALEASKLLKELGPSR